MKQSTKKQVIAALKNVAELKDLNLNTLKAVKVPTNKDGRKGKVMKKYYTIKLLETPEVCAEVQKATQKHTKEVVFVESVCEVTLFGEATEPTANKKEYQKEFEYFVKQGSEKILPYVTALSDFGYKKKWSSELLAEGLMNIIGSKVEEIHDESEIIVFEFQHGYAQPPVELLAKQ